MKSIQNHESEEFEYPSMKKNIETATDEIAHISPYETLLLVPKKVIPNGMALILERASRYWDTVSAFLN